MPESRLKNLKFDSCKCTTDCQLAGELLAGDSLCALGGAGIVKLTQKKENHKQPAQSMQRMSRVSASELETSHKAENAKGKLTGTKYYSFKKVLFLIRLFFSKVKPS